LGFCGCNLTIPHKEAAMGLVDVVEDAARAIGAINCVTVGADGRLTGANYDALGFTESVRAAGPGWEAAAGPAVVLGAGGGAGAAGGGARAVVFSLIERGVPEIRIANRTADRAKALAADLKGPVVAVAWEEREAALDGAKLLVNTTSQGMVGQPALDIRLDA